LSIRKPVVLRDVNVYHRKHKVGEGTYGSVFMGADKVTGEIVALKRINTEQEENGFPITAIREVKILKALEHKNIVKLIEIVTSQEQNEIPRNVYMVFEYHEYDLTGILQTGEIRLTQDHIKSWSKQLLAGTHYMHVNKIIHRDLKASNILIGKNGELKIADWGLARSWNAGMKQLTNGVVTRWYRPIELLLGCKEYSPKIDMWSVGCIIAEMFRRDGLLKGGDSEASQLNLIFQTCGHPSVNDWPKIRQLCPLWSNFEPRPDEPLLPNRLAQVLRQRLPHPQWMTNNAIVLIQNLLTYNPDDRWDAKQALGADYFYENPMVKEASDLHMKFGVEHAHELAIRKKYMNIRAANGSNPSTGH
jgi:cyclin-dependent kinase 12/13